MANHSITYLETATPGHTLYRVECDCGWNTGEFHTKLEATKRAQIHLAREDPIGAFLGDPLDQLGGMADKSWRSADGKVWLINPLRAGLINPDMPIMTPTHAQKCIDHLRRRQIYGPFTRVQDMRFENAPIIKAFRRRIAGADSVEWRDAKWHDWMYEKRHGVRPG